MSENRSLVTIANLSKEKIMYLLQMAQEFEKRPNRKILEDNCSEPFGCKSNRIY